MSENTPEGKEDFPHDRAELSDREKHLLNQIEEFDEQIAEIKEDMVLLSTVEIVLEEYGLSPAKATEIAETIAEVDEGLSGDDDV